MRGRPGQHLQLGLVAAVGKPALAGGLQFGTVHADLPTARHDHHHGRRGVFDDRDDRHTGSTLPPVSTSGPLTLGAPIVLPVLGRPCRGGGEPRRRRLRRPARSDQPVALGGLGHRRQRPGAGRRARGDRHRRAGRRQHQLLRGHVLRRCSPTTAPAAIQDGQWTMPAVPTANSSNNDLVALVAANGSVFISVTRGNTVSVYKLNPGAATAPQLLVRGLGAAIGSDGSVYLRAHATTRWRRGGPTAPPSFGPDAGGQAQRPRAEACSTSTWSPAARCGSASPPARASMRPTPPTTPPRSTRSGSFQGLGDEHGGRLQRPAPWRSSRPAAIRPARRRRRRRRPRASSASCRRARSTNAVGRRCSAVTLIGPDPAVIVSDTASGQFDLVRLS